MRNPAYAAKKGLDLTASWVANVEDSSPTEEFDENSNDNVSMTPLAMALMFGQFDAAVALIEHGAKIPNIGSSTGLTRRLFLNVLFENDEFSALLDTIKNSGDEGERAVEAFKVTIAPVSDNEDSDEDQEDEYKVSQLKVLL